MDTSALLPMRTCENQRTYISSFNVSTSTNSYTDIAARFKRANSLFKEVSQLVNLINIGFYRMALQLANRGDINHHYL